MCKYIRANITYLMVLASLASTTGAYCSDSSRPLLIQADLEREAAVALVMLNNDDDNSNDLVDLAERSRVVGDNDLVGIVLDGISLAGGEKLSLVIKAGDQKVKIWLDREKSLSVAVPLEFSAGNLPDTVWVEGVKLSESLNDVVIALSAGGRNTKVKCTVIALFISEIKGLYKQDGSYEAGYKSADNKGRVYSNRVYSDADPGVTIWTRDKQYIDIVAKIVPDVGVPTGSKVIWNFKDVDDPSNNEPGMQPGPAKLIDGNDYDGVDNDGDGQSDNHDGNDNSGVRDALAVWEELPPFWALSNGNETEISFQQSKVRFNVTDQGGDNFVVTANLWMGPIGSGSSDRTGVFSVWKKIDVELVRMAGRPNSADEAPMARVNPHFRSAYVEFGPIPERLVPPRYFRFKQTTVRDFWSIGKFDDWAKRASRDYADYRLSMYSSASRGEFSREGPGWMFVAAAHDYVPLSSKKSLVLYPRPLERNDQRDQLDSWCFGDKDRNHRLYVSLDRVGQRIRVRLYNNANRRPGDLVGEGIGAGPAIAIKANGADGVYGYVRCLRSANRIVADTDIEIAISRFGPGTIGGRAGADPRVHVTLDAPLPDGPGIPNLYEIEDSRIKISNAAKTRTVQFGTWSPDLSPDRRTPYVIWHSYSPVENPNSTARKYLTDHGWSRGDRVDLKVLSPGGYGVAGIADSVDIQDGNTYFDGRVMMFSGFGGAGVADLETMVHELGHALGFAHRCGNVDYAGLKPCFMTYGSDFLLEGGGPDPKTRVVLLWTGGESEGKLCARHIVGIRQARLEKNSQGRRLGW